MADTSKHGEFAIEMKGVSFAYDHRPVIQDASFTIPNGEMVCIVGPNGGGKTTLLKLVLGLVKPSKGTINVLGQPVGCHCGCIGYVPQHIRFDPLFPVNVLDVVLMGCVNHINVGSYSKKDRDNCLAALEKVGLTGLETRHFSQLSGGQRQRVLIARALASGPELLLLDEPTSSVDTLTEQKLLELLKSLNEKFTIVMVSHDVGMVSSLVKRVICVNIHVDEHPTTELTGENLREMYGADKALVRHDKHISGECLHE